MTPKPEVPQKIFRHVLKGVSYFSNRIKRASLNEVAAYVYLKNNRSFSFDTTSQLTRTALDQLCSEGLIRNMRATYRLNVPKAKKKRTTQRRTNAIPQTEQMELSVFSDSQPGSSSGRRPKSTNSPHPQDHSQEFLHQPIKVEKLDDLFPTVAKIEPVE